MNHINNKFPIKCRERYTNLKVIEPQVYAILDTVLPSETSIKAAIYHVNRELCLHQSDKSAKLLRVLEKIDALRNQLSEYTDGFIDKKYTKETYDMLTQKINTRLKEYQSQVSALEDGENYVQA